MLESSYPYDARARADRIRRNMRATAQWYRDVIDAYRADDWRCLGYDSWGAYLSGEFGEARLALGREDRAVLHRTMREVGMPVRAAAAVTGSSIGTVSNDTSGVQNRTPDAATHGRDGKTYSRRCPAPKPARSGATTWSRRVQAVSAKAPMDDLTNDEVKELHGAATFLRDYCQGELEIRKEKG